MGWKLSKQFGITEWRKSIWLGIVVLTLRDLAWNYSAKSRETKKLGIILSWESILLGITVLIVGNLSDLEVSGGNISGSKF